MVLLCTQCCLKLKPGFVLAQRQTAAHKPLTGRVLLAGNFEGTPLAEDPLLQRLTTDEATCARIQVWLAA